MAGILMNGISAGAPGMTASALLPAAALGKGAKAAREFEAQLIATVLESLEKSFAGVPGQDSVAGPSLTYGPFLGPTAPGHQVRTANFCSVIGESVTGGSVTGERI